MAISDTTFLGPTQIHRQATRQLQTKGNLALLHPRTGPSPSGPTTESSDSQSPQSSCTAPPLKEKRFDGPEERQGRKPITAEGSPHQARLRGGVIGQDGQPEQPIELSETGGGRVPGAHRAVKAPKSQGPKGPGSDYSCSLYPLPSSLFHGCWPAALPADYGWRKDGGSGG